MGQTSTETRGDGWTGKNLVLPRPQKPGQSDGGGAGVPHPGADAPRPWAEPVGTTPGNTGLGVAREKHNLGVARK